MSSSLPPGWTSAIDPSSGNLYYANSRTGESSWIPPPPVQLPPPPTHLRPPPPIHHRPPPFQGGHKQSSTNTTASFGNKISTVSSIKALASSGLLVPAARAVVDSHNTVSEGTDDRKRLELQGLTPGQMADLCAIQREEMAEKQVDYKPYTPINPHALSNTAKREPMEPGRLEIRIHSLFNQLRKIQEKKT